jgi:ABC-2 type transport system ATP-binding protein
MYDDPDRQGKHYFFRNYGLSRIKIKKKSPVSLRIRLSASKQTGLVPIGLETETVLSVVLLHETKIVFLDEPTGGVDPITRRQFGNDL